MKLIILRECDGLGGHYDTIFDGEGVSANKVDNYVEHLLHQIEEDEYENGEEFEKADIPDKVKEKFRLREIYDVDVIEYEV